MYRETFTAFRPMHDGFTHESRHLLALEGVDAHAARRAAARPSILIRVRAWFAARRATAAPLRHPYEG